MKSLMISYDAYAKLASIKGKKSFTDLILDITECVKQDKQDRDNKVHGHAER